MGRIRSGPIWSGKLIPMNGRQPSDKQLLELEIDTLWSRNENGRLVRDRGLNGTAAPHLVIASLRDATVVAFGDEVPESVAREISGLLPATSILGSTLRQLRCKR